MTETATEDETMTETATEDGPMTETAPDETMTKTADDDESLDDRRYALSDTSRPLRALEWVALGVLSLLAIYALIQFYGSVSEAISLWIAAEYEPLFQAGFNLVVLLVAVVGTLRLVERIANDETP